MAAQTRQAKVLRIGIIQDGKIVQERLIKAGEAVSVGESPKNTFVFPKTHLPSASFVIFKPSGKGYVLQFTAGMKGKISAGGAVVALQKLLEDPAVTKKGGVASLPLTEQDRGKISVDSVTVLFQFVAPPPQKAVKPIQAMDFRPRLIEEDDPIFLGFLGVWAALGLVLAIWVWQADPPELTIDDVPERFVKLVVVEKPPPELPPEPTDQGAQKSGEAQKEQENKGPKSEIDKIKGENQLKENVLKNSVLLTKLIGTTGESSSGFVENLWSDQEQGLGNVDAALRDAAGATGDAGAATRTGGAGGTGASDIGELGTIGGGGASDVSVVVKVKPRVSAEGGSIAGTGDENQIKATVNRYTGQLTYCYEKQLKVNPNLQGRIEVGWTVVAGAVTGAPYIIANTTGDSALADCVTGKIRRWQFPADADGPMSWPFVFTAQK